jgi:hypothetical protein
MDDWFGEGDPPIDPHQRDGTSWSIDSDGSRTDYIGTWQISLEKKSLNARDTCDFTPRSCPRGRSDNEDDAPQRPKERWGQEPAE